MMKRQSAAKASSPRPDPAITVLLVRTHSPGNLGAALRAAANFGARLSLMDPRTPLDHPDVAAHASGADSILQAARCFSNLPDATADSDLIVALTSTRGRTTGALPPAIDAAALRRALAAGKSIALVFGPERSGLRTEEILECDRRWILPAEASFPTLNLSHAVAVSLALLHRVAASARTGKRDGERVRRETWRRLLVEVRSALKSEFPARRKRPDVVDEMIAALRRLGPTQREAELLLALLGNRGKGRG